MSLLFERESGILLHPSCLPGPYGIGEMGDHLYRWLEVLEESDQSLWQVLPLTPPSNAYSPYQSSSSFAGDVLLISLDRLVEACLLDRRDVSAANAPPGPIDFVGLRRRKLPLLHQAARRMLDGDFPELAAGYDVFCWRHKDWLLDSCRFEALRAVYDGEPWYQWPADIRRRHPAALRALDQELASAIEVQRVLQYLFEQQWQEVRRRARGCGVRIIGDLPIFVAHDSADVWAHQELFRLDAQGQPTVVAGVPPDYFSATGQRWGNPLFNWDAHQTQDFEWWRRRMKRSLQLADVVRVDHFRGFAACWEIPAQNPTAEGGRWVPAPGKQLFEHLTRDLGRPLPIIAEDLGIITDDVDALRDALGLPTMRVLQFSFSGEEKLLPYHFPENCVAFTGTHDNDTTVGWYTSDPTNMPASPDEVEAERDRVRRYFATDGTDIQWTCIKCVLESRASAAIVPLQDVMGLGSEARMNTPGTVGPHNWSWRFEWEQLTPAMLDGLRHISREAGRNRVLRRNLSWRPSLAPESSPMASGGGK